MAVESAADRAAMFDTADFAVTASWTSRLGGAAVQVAVIPISPEQAYAAGEGPSVAGIATSVFITAEALPGRPESGDRLEWDGAGYKIAEVLQDSTGHVFTCHLRRA